MGRELCFTIPGNFDFSCFSSLFRSRILHRIRYTFGPHFSSLLEPKTEKIPVRQGEKFHESLINSEELRNTFDIDNPPSERLRELVGNLLNKNT